MLSEVPHLRCSFCSPQTCKYECRQLVSNCEAARQNGGEMGLGLNHWARIKLTDTQRDAMRYIGLVLAKGTAESC